MGCLFMKTKLEKELKALEPKHKARKKIEKIKEQKQLDQYYDELLNGLK